MARVTSTKSLDPALLELTFRKLSTCKFRPPNRAMHKDLNYLTKLSKSRNAPSIWTVHEIVKILNSCALIGYLNPAFLSELGREITSRTMSSDMDHLQLTIVVKSLGRLGQLAVNINCLQPCGIFFGISEVLVQILNEIVKPDRCVSFTEEHLTEIWNGVAILRCYNANVLKELAIETSKPHRLMRFTEPSIATLVYSVAILKFQNRLFCRALLEECIQSHRLPSYTTGELSKIYHSLGLMELHVENTLSALDAEITKSHRLEEFEERDLVIIVISYGVLRWFNPSSVIKLIQEITKARRMQAFRKNGFSQFAKIIGKIEKHDDYSLSKEIISECAKEPVSSFFYKA